MTHNMIFLDRAMAELSYLDRCGERLAHRRQNGAGPGIVWLGGFRSDMEGIKAQAVDAWAARNGRACLRFDYFGHGASSGAFTDGTISRWRDDALTILDAQTKGPQILVGSSMGGWISVLVARARPERVAGLLLIAPAADFTEELMWKEMPEEARRELLELGVWTYQSEVAGESFPITRALIEDGRSNLVLGETIVVAYPVRILQGMADLDVPWTHTMKLVGAIKGDVTITLVKSGDHRLSTSANLALLERTLDGLVKDVIG